MTTAAKMLRYIAFVLMALFAVLGAAFIAAETLTDPGGVAAVLLSASWAIPLIALAAFALWRPDMAAMVLTVLATLVALFVVLDGMFGIVPMDDIGPVGAIGVFAVAVPLGFLGVHRPLAAGLLLLLVGAATIAAAFARTLGEAPAGAAIGGSAGAVAVPVVFIGVLFLIAAALQPRPRRGQRDRGDRAHLVGSNHG